MPDTPASADYERVYCVVCGVDRPAGQHCFNCGNDLPCPAHIDGSGGAE